MNVPEPRAARAAPAAIALAALVVHAACGGRYGVFRDELYFIVCGERLAAGYVDQPPGIALLARIAHGLFGTSVVGLRLLPWLASAWAVYLAGRLAGRVGGGRFAALLAAAAVLASPLLLALGHLLTMNAFELLAALLLAHLLVSLAAGGSSRLWLAAGGVAAAGVLLKYTFAILVLALVAGLVASPARGALRTRWAAAGAALALLLVLPNLVWQARHGFPFLELVRNGQLHKNVPFSLAAFAGALLLEPGPLLAPVWVGGLVWLSLSPRAAGVRFLGIGAGLYLVVLAASKGKPYYAAPVLPLLLAGGAVATERILRARRARAAAAVAIAVAGAVLAPLTIPLLPAPRFVAYQDALGLRPPATERHEMGVLPQHFADQFGWEALADAVAQVHGSLPAAERERAAIFAQNYGEAAAIDVHGAGRGLPPAASGHNNYFLWGPPPGRGDPLIVVSDAEEDCGGAYRERSVAAKLPSSPWVMPYEDARWIWVCRGATRPLPALWSAVRRFI